MNVAEAVQILIEEGEKRGMSLAETIHSFRENTALVTEKAWNGMGGCPCCPTYAEHVKLVSSIIDALEQTGTQ